MSDRPIQNCGWRFEFKCPKTWDALRETSEAGVRACDQCQQLVYLCQSESEVSLHVRERHCIAVPAGVRISTLVPEPPLTREEPLDVGLVRPWEEAEPGLTRALLDLMLTAACRAGAEQIRIEATDTRLVVRHLVAGLLREVHWPPLKLREALLRHLQARSGASEGQPGLLEHHSRGTRARYQVLLRRLERDVEVVLLDLDARTPASGRGGP